MTTQPVHHNLHRARLARALAASLPPPRVVLVTPTRCVVASGEAERRSALTFDVVDEVWADGRLWFLRAPFDAQRAWSGLDGISLWRPREALILDDDNPDGDPDHVVRVDAHGARTRVPLPALPLPVEHLEHPEEVHVDDALDEEGYERAVERSLAHIAAGLARKLVVARRARLTLPRNPPVPALVESLVAQFGAGASTIYLLETEDGALLFGASPEQLLRRRGDAVEVDAVAGTRPLAEAASLVESEKDRREHALVVDGVVSALAFAGATVTSVSPVRAAERGGLVHLAATVSATMRGGPARVLTALHPTAATAGTPSVDAVALLRALEDFPRGDYGGLLGVLDRTLDGEARTAEIAVALRAARLSHDGAFVYAGAGIVAGSDPHSEWRETSQKARVLLPAIARALAC